MASADERGVRALNERATPCRQHPLSWPQGGHTGRVPDPDEVQKLADHIDVVGLRPVSVTRGWPHLGAVLADASLQAGVGYLTTVRPRVVDLMQAWPDANTTSGMVRRMSVDDVGAVLRWRGKKLVTLSGLVAAMQDLDVETVDDLRARLSDPVTREATVSRLRQVSGVGPKTLDYLGILVGLADRVAVDVHVRRFARAAGLQDLRYDHLQGVLTAVASLRAWDLGALDAAIWDHMSKPGRG